MINELQFEEVKDYLMQFTEYLKDYIISKIESENLIEVIYTEKHWFKAFNSDLRLSLELSRINEEDIVKEQRIELFRIWSNAIIKMLNDCSKENGYLIDSDNNNTIYIITP